jgi:hypothetical protein
VAPLGKLGRLVHLGTLPETRRIVFSPETRRQIRVAANRLVHDRAQLARDVARPAGVGAFARKAIRHPATHELLSVGLLFTPERYLPIGWAAGWATRRIARRMGRRQAIRN